jgi:transposase-like protein
VLPGERLIVLLRGRKAIPNYFRHSRVDGWVLASSGVVLTYETIRAWCLKFGHNDLRRRSPWPGDKWYLDEVFVKINASIHYLRRAVDQDGEVLDIQFQSRRDKRAAKKFFRKSSGHGQRFLSDLGIISAHFRVGRHLY